MTAFADYYKNIKPGIVYGNVLHAFLGACFGLLVLNNWAPVVPALVGIALVIASACTVNNYFDRDIDTYMKRTKSRPTVKGQIGRSSTIMQATLLGVAGFCILLFAVNVTVALLGVVAYIWYAGLYTWAKRKTVHSTLIGTIPGALPVTAGYVAVVGWIDIVAILLTVLLIVWQLPHFYAIAVFRKKEYEAAKIPVLASFVTHSAMQKIIIATIAIYVAVLGMTLYFAQVAMGVYAVFVLLGLWWLIDAVRTQSRFQHIAWARRIFGHSLVVTMASVLIMTTSVVAQWVATVVQ